MTQEQFEVVNITGLILGEVKNPKMKRNDVAVSYASLFAFILLGSFLAVMVGAPFYYTH